MGSARRTVTVMIILIGACRHEQTGTYKNVAYTPLIVAIMVLHDFLLWVHLVHEEIAFDLSKLDLV